MSDRYPYLVNADASIRYCLELIERFKHPVFVQDESRRLLGSFSDGDFRRFIANHRVEKSVDVLSFPVQMAANLEPHWSTINGDQLVLHDLLERFRVVPILDEVGRISEFKEHPRKNESIILFGKLLSPDTPPLVIAEIGLNHNGDLQVAEALIRQAHEAGADAVKFQIRDMSSIYRRVDGAAEDLGAEYTVDLINECDISFEDYVYLFEFCECNKINYFCTPWDESSAKRLLNLGQKVFKVSSADLTNLPLIELLGTRAEVLILSTGMSTEDEIIEAVDLLSALPAKTVFLHCNSSYPAPYKDINLRYIRRLREITQSPVGYSSHDRGLEACIAAVALGATVIEKHVTLDKDQRGLDHSSSLLPTELEILITSFRNVVSSLGVAKRQISQGEALNRLSLAKSLVATRDLKEGRIVSLDDVCIRSPGRGLQPTKLQKLLGTTLRAPKKRGDFFYPSDISDGSVVDVPKFEFELRFGIPVRWHDHQMMLSEFAPDFLEFHFSYRDLDFDIECFSMIPGVGYTVHSPDLFENDFLLDLSSLDEPVRRASVKSLQKVINLTRSMRPFFPDQAVDPFVIASLGGYSIHEFCSLEESARRTKNLFQSISELDLSGVNLLPQTLPPFPWYKGGQMFMNLFVDPEEVLEFCRLTGLSICLDISHLKLACNYKNVDFYEAFEMLLPYSPHIHVSDSQGLGGEGLQIGTGEIDFEKLASIIKSSPKYQPGGLWFIPEVWQGHVDSGSGFREALIKLSGLL